MLFCPIFNVNGCNNPWDWFSGNCKYWYENGIKTNELKDLRSIFSYDPEKEYDEIHCKWFVKE